MKILVVCQHYAPEPFRHPDICEELARRGHEVTVITGQPNYPMGVIYEGYQGRKKRQEASTVCRFIGPLRSDADAARSSGY